MPSEAAQEAAAQVVADGLFDTPTDVPQEATEAAEQQSENVFDPELPDDIRADLEEPDFEVDDDPDPVYQPEAEADEDDEYEDPEVTKYKNKLRATEKKLEWEQEQRLTRSRKEWVEKEGKFFPFADAKEMAEKAGSRREFRRLMQAENDRVKSIPGVKEMIAAKAQEPQKEIQDPDSWGKPATGAGAVPSEATTYQQNIERARETGNLKEVIKARIFGPAE